MSVPKVSIIVPVYNTEKNVSKCVESIISQTFIDWELILIDDGSKDDSGKICDKYSLSDSRIKVIHQENQGVSAARNRGLDIARGEWVLFCDSDDEFFPHTVEELYTCVSNDCTLVLAGYDKIYDNGSPSLKDIHIVESHNQCLEWSKQKMIKELFEPEDKIYKGVICSKLFKKNEIEINNIRFCENIKYNEDRLFVLTYLSFMNGTTYYTPTIVYKYYQHNESAMGQILSDVFETDLDAFLKMIDIIDNLKQTELSKIVRKWAVLSWFINYRIKDKEDLKTKRRRLNDKIHSKVNRKEFLYGVLFSLTYVIKSKLAKWKNMIIS